MFAMSGSRSWYLICTKRFCYKQYWVVIPAAHNSVAEEVSPDFESALPHFEIERVCRVSGRSHTVRCSLKPPVKPV